MTPERVARKWGNRKESPEMLSGVPAEEAVPGLGPTNRLAAKRRPPTPPVIMPFISRLP